MLRFSALVFGLLLWVGSTPATIAGELDEIYSLADREQFAEAMKRLEPFLKKNPRDAQGRFLKGLILTEQKQREEAILIFKSLSADYPDLPEPYNNLAVLYAEKGLYEEASDSLKKAIHTHPSYATAHENLGDIYAKMASQAYSKALSLNSGNNVTQTKLDLIRKLFDQRAAGADQQKIAAAGVTSSPPSPKNQPRADTVEERPVVTPSASPGDLQIVKADVEKSVQNWAKAWSDKDLDGYMGAYSDHFQIPRPFTDFKDWQKRRRDLVSKAHRIRITLSDVQVSMLNPQRAQVAFIQNYQSPTYRDRVSKTLSLVLENGVWKIVREHSGK